MEGIKEEGKVANKERRDGKKRRGGREVGV